ncbi:uncharacterized protein LOC105237469 isoform X3 [Ailuropoda melanoleuca]|uniref:uncharacterized protein LOC105237469 isoform X3 n=1 Tax=Ailuropoda melanoleuca TaxID=9646 RepID=UPI001493FB92|nr:uncharacterized protein LOC105237469 isoform X3 [Ailuropoda melanoleuca]
MTCKPARGCLWGQAAVGHTGRAMDWVKRKGRWGEKKPRLEGKEAGSEHQQMLPSEAQGHRRQQPKGHPPKPKRGIVRFLGALDRNKRPQNAIHLTEISKGFSELVQEGQFLEAYQSISVLAEEGQGCSPRYEVLAQSMWQVVQQALEGTGPSQELERKLQAVLATVDWTQDKDQSREAGGLQDGPVATWAGQLQKLLRSDAEARVPTLGPKDALDPYLEKLDKAVRRGLGSPRARLLGTRLWEAYRVYFQEALLSRLFELMDSCGTSLKSRQVLYTWGKTNLFGQPGRETLVKAPPTSQEPTVWHLLDPVMFVTWMSKMQKELVGLIQEELEKCLKRVLIHDRKKWAQSSHPTFLEIFQLLEKTNAVQLMGPSITSQVRKMVLETFSEFLGWYRAEAVDILQQNAAAAAAAFPEVHVLANCCILRKTWQELSQEQVLWADLGPAVQGTIQDIEDHSRDNLLPRVRALCQSLLRGHFGKKDKDLVGALQSLWQGLEGCPNMHSTPTYERIMRSLHMVVFGEYVQALGMHLRTLEPGTWEGLRVQVETDTRKLHDIFTKHGESIMGILQSSESKSRETVDDWLASFRDRFPGYLRFQSSRFQSCTLVVAQTRSSRVHRRSPHSPAFRTSHAALWTWTRRLKSREATAAAAAAADTPSSGQDTSSQSGADPGVDTSYPTLSRKHRC